MFKISNHSKLLQSLSKYNHSYHKKKPPSFKKQTPISLNLQSDPKPKIKAAYLASAGLAGTTGLLSVYYCEKVKKQSSKNRWFSLKKQRDERPFIDIMSGIWKSYKAEISYGLVCGLPVFFYLKNFLKGLKLQNYQLFPASGYQPKLNQHGYIKTLNQIMMKRQRVCTNYFANFGQTLREIAHRTFSHSGIIHLGFNTYLAYSLMDTSLNSYRDQWDYRHISAAIFGGIFSTSIAAKLGQLGLGFSGGVYSILGYFCASQSMNHLRFNIIFDINNNYPFGLADFGANWIPIETVLAVMQAFGLNFSPIAHIGHVSGFFYGILVYYVFQEVYRPGYMEMALRSKLEAFQKTY